MMNYLWPILGIIGLVWGLAAGNASVVTSAALGGAIDAVRLCAKLAGGFALWSGLIAIIEKTGAIDKLAGLFKPVLSRLFPGVNDDARRYIALNFTANALGLGNAATPLGLDAMRSMSAGSGRSAGTTGSVGSAGLDGSDRASDAMIMFLVINASSLQLFPTTVIALRAAAGSARPASILTATLVSTGISTIAAIAACLLFRRIYKNPQNP